MSRPMPATTSRSRRWRGGEVPDFDPVTGEVIEPPPAPAKAPVAVAPRRPAPAPPPAVPKAGIQRTSEGFQVIGEPSPAELSLAGLVLLSEVASKIGTRDQGPAGRNGESIIEFRNGYRELVDVIADSHKPPYPPHTRFIGHSIVGTAETDPGWWIELWTGGLFTGLTVKVAEGVQGGQLTWAERGSYAYQRSEFKTLRQRERIKRQMREDFDGFWAECVDTGLPGFAKHWIAEWVFRLIEQRPDVMDLAVDGQQAEFEKAVDAVFTKTIFAEAGGLVGLEEAAALIRANEVAAGNVRSTQ